MTTLRISDIADMTGLSMRYWQRRVADGGVPGAKELTCGKEHLHRALARNVVKLKKG